MGLLRRPSMGDRMDNAQQKRERPKGSVADLVARAEMVADETSRRRAKHRIEGTRPYRGSQQETEHRSWLGKKK